MPAATLFFDLDGCLVDSRVAITGSMNDALRALGLPPRPPQELHRHIGPPLRTAFIELLGGAVRADDAVAAYRTVYRRRMLADTVVVPGITTALSSLQNVARLLVVTSKPQVFAEPILQALDLRRFFDAVAGPSLDALDETKTETLARAIQSCGGHAQLTSAWMIGDRHHDIEAGRRNAIGTVAVTWGIGDRAELTRAGPDRIVDAPEDLAALVTD